MAKKAKEEEFIEIEVELADDTFLQIAEEAHRNDITFNEMCRILITEYLNFHKSAAGEAQRQSVKPKTKKRKANAKPKSPKKTRPVSKKKTKTS